MAEKLDKQFNVRLTNEMYEKLENMAGDQKREWLEKAVAIMEAQSVRDFATDYAPDLKEVEIHTARLYEVITNIVQRSVYLKDNAVNELTKQLEQKEAIIGEFQAKANKAVHELQLMTSEYELMQQTQDGLEKQLNELRTSSEKQLEDMRVANENNQRLIQEYISKNDTLTGLVNKYEAFAKENEELKKTHEDEMKDIRSEVYTLTEANNELQQDFNDMKYQLKDKDIERERALLQLERQYQSKLASANEEYASTLKGLYEQINSLRSERERRIEIIEQNDNHQDKAE